MIQTTSMLVEALTAYSDPFGKIRRLCEEGRLHKLTKGIYETDGSISGYLLAPVLYGPSYLSFEYVLSRYGLIPETVYEYTSATCGKGKKKTYRNRFGEYSYRDIPISVFPYATELLEENGYYYSIATPEKALCDKVYTLSPVKNTKAMRDLLFDDLRIYETGFMELDLQVIEQLSDLYHCNNVSMLASLMRRIRS